MPRRRTPSLFSKTKTSVDPLGFATDSGGASSCGLPIWGRWIFYPLNPLDSSQSVSSTSSPGILHLYPAHLDLYQLENLNDTSGYGNAGCGFNALQAHRLAQSTSTHCKLRLIVYRLPLTRRGPVGRDSLGFFSWEETPLFFFFGDTCLFLY